MSKQLPLFLPDPNDAGSLLSAATALIQRAEALMHVRTQHGAAPQEVRSSAPRPRRVTKMPPDPIPQVELIKLPNMSRSTLFRWRKAGKITYCKRVGNATFYSRAEIARLRRAMGFLDEV